MFENDKNRFGSASIAEREDFARAGMFDQQPGSMFLGFFDGRPVWYSGAGGALLVAGARGGKLRDFLAYNLCSGILQYSLAVLDLKGELAAISQNQTADLKFCAYWNPRGLHGLPQHRLNPVDYVCKASPTLVSDVKVLCEQLVPLSGSRDGRYFEHRAQEFLEAVILTLVELVGVLTLPDLFRAVNLIPGGSDAWLAFALEMARSEFEIARRVEEEIAASRQTSSNGFIGIIGEMLKALAPLSDPTLMTSVSPPYDFSMADLCAGSQAWQVYLMCPAEYVSAWAPVLKSIFTAGMIYKARAPHAPRQVWILDEAAQLKGFPLVQMMYTYGAGIGVQPLAVYQALDQLRATAPDAETIIPSSAACQVYFAIRDYGSAQRLSAMIGQETLRYDDTRARADESHSRQQALRAILSGEDALAAGLRYAHHKKTAKMQAMQARPVRTPDELLNMPGDRALVFVDGLGKPAWLERRPYYEQQFMAGRYFPNPYHPPHDRVRVKSWIGWSTLRVVEEPVPAAFRHYPQYRNGRWKTLKG